MVQPPAPGVMSQALLLVKLERVQLLIKTASVKTVDNVGIKMYKSLYTVNTKNRLSNVRIQTSKLLQRTKKDPGLPGS